MKFTVEKEVRTFYEPCLKVVDFSMRTVKRLCLHLANATAYSRGLEQSSGTSFYLIAQWGSQLIQDWKKIDRKSRDEHDSKRFAIRLNYTAPRRSSTLFSWANILTEACPSLELSKKITRGFVPKGDKHFCHWDKPSPISRYNQPTFQFLQDR